MANPYTAKTAGPMMSGDWDAQQRQIEYERKVAERLAGDTEMPQGGMVGGVYVPASWTQMLAKALNPMMARQHRESADKKATALGAEMQAERTGTMDRYSKALQGTPEQVLPPDVFGPAAPAVPGSRDAALAELAKSRDPAFQQMAMAAQLKGLDQGKFGHEPKFDSTGKAYLISDRGELKYLDGVTPRDKNEFVNGQAVNPYSTKPGTVIPKQANPYSDLVVPGANGAIVANAPLLEAKKSIAKAGASNVSVNTAQKPFLTEIGKGVGESVNTAFTQAQQANQTLANVQQMRSGLGNVIVGPAANARVTLAQIGEVLGVNGKDSTEKLQNTRNVMQGLARQELAAAGQMKGQGQITESERAILRKAESGQINEITVPELNTMMAAMERTANFRISTHNANLERLRKDPNASAMVDYMTIPGQQVAPAAKGGASSDWKDL